MSMTLAESAEAVGALRRARRKQRVASIHWVDALYQVYVTGIVAVAVVVLLSGAVGDGEVSTSTLLDVIDHGPAAMGLVAALSVLMGLRSGSRGGPLALERPDVRHVLLSPVDRGVALRGPAWRQLRFLTAAGAAVGATAGQLALRRLPGNAILWMLAGVAFVVAVVWIGYGCALVASGLKVPSWVASGIGGFLVVWQVGDLTNRLPVAPGTVVGRMALWPIESPTKGHPDFDPLAIVGLLLGVLLVFLGMRFVAGTSLEAAERRTALVGQMRFAVTLQDLRTVLVLRRQLAQERPRSTPWVRGLNHKARFPVFRRGVRSVARWPLSRIVRVVLMAIVAGLSMRGVWAGTTPLVILAGLALWVAALDAAEPLGQEIDHPGRTDAFPMDRGELLIKHLPIAFVTSTTVGLLAGIVALAPWGAGVPVGPALVAGASAGLLAACGAIISVVQGAPDPVDTLSMVTPEIAGTRTVYRTAFPPAVAILGTMPLLAARASERGAGEPPPVAAAMNIVVLLMILLVLVCGWVRFRDQIRQWMADAADQMSPTKAAERQREERLAADQREAEAIASSKKSGQEAAKRAKAKAAPKPKTTKPVAPTPQGAQGGTSSKPIGRKRDQR